MTRQSFLPSQLAPVKTLPYRIVELPQRAGRGKNLVEVEDVLADLYAQGYRLIGCGNGYVVLEFQMRSLRSQQSD